MNKAAQSLLVGYDLMEQWFEVVDKERPVYAKLVREQQIVAANNLWSAHLIIWVAQPESMSDLVHYVRLNVGTLQFIGDKPFDNDHEQRIALAESAFEIVHKWLEEQGLDVRPGLVAVPEHVRLLDGWAGFMVFDTKEGCFKSL